MQRLKHMTESSLTAATVYMGPFSPMSLQSFLNIKKKKWQIGLDRTPVLWHYTTSVWTQMTLPLVKCCSWAAVQSAWDFSWFSGNARKIGKKTKNKKTIRGKRDNEKERQFKRIMLRDIQSSVVFAHYLRLVQQQVGKKDGKQSFCYTFTYHQWDRQKGFEI